MIQAREELLGRADEFERMAACASSDVLRCRYMSMARYWAILAEEAVQGVSVGPHLVARPESGSLNRAA
jgi:hypothetical protein